MHDFENIKCDNCGSLGLPVLEVEKYQICECPLCSLRYVNPQPSSEHLKAFYSKDFYDNYTNKGYLTEEEYLQKDWDKKLDFIESRFNKTETQLLEVGSACGLFLKYCQHRGWKNCEGVEYSEWAAKYARENFNVKVQGCDLLAAKFSLARFDVVVMWATIEHLKNPKEIISEIFRLLKPGGLLMLNTGNDSKKYRLASTGYSMWYDLPGHLFFYNPQSLAFLLSKVGFESVKVESDDIACSVYFRLMIKKLKNTIFNRAAFKSRGRFGVLMTAFASKARKI